MTDSNDWRSLLTTFAELDSKALQSAREKIK
jgi:hypothetical protein